MAQVPTLRKTRLDALAIALLLGCCLFWGFQQVLVKATVVEVPPVWQVSMRFAAATLILMAWCAWRGIALWSDDGCRKIGVFAGLLFALEFLCVYVGLQMTSASRLTIFLYTAPFWVALILPFFVASERLHVWQWLGLVLAFGGVVVALWQRVSGDGSWVGDLIGVGGGLFWGLTTVLIRSTGLAKLPPEKTLFYQISVAACVLPFCSLAMGESWAVSHYSAFAWSSLLVQTLVGAFASYLLWMWLLTRYPATKMGTFVFLTPVFAMVFGAVWLKETITPSLLIALAMVALGIVLVNRRKA
jgi:drug/metabolite transporter (DMT)-like permease